MLATSAARAGSYPLSSGSAARFRLRATRAGLLPRLAQLGDPASPLPGLRKASRGGDALPLAGSLSSRRPSMNARPARAHGAARCGAWLAHGGAATALSFALRIMFHSVAKPLVRIAWKLALSATAWNWSRAWRMQHFVRLVMAGWIGGRGRTNAQTTNSQGLAGEDSQYQARGRRMLPAVGGSSARAGGRSMRNYGNGVADPVGSASTRRQDRACAFRHYGKVAAASAWQACASSDCCCRKAPV